MVSVRNAPIVWKTVTKDLSLKCYFQDISPSSNIFSKRHTFWHFSWGCTCFEHWGGRGRGVSLHMCPCMQQRKELTPMLKKKNKKKAFSVSYAINQCPGQPGREHFQTHLQQIMPAIPPSPRDEKASLMNHCPFRTAAEWSSPCCAYRVLLCLPAKTVTKMGRKENGIRTLRQRNRPCWKCRNPVLRRAFVFRNVKTSRKTCNVAQLYLIGYMEMCNLSVHETS